jgi:hypothetical protein
LDQCHLLLAPPDERTADLQRPPALYVGQSSDFDHPVMSILARQSGRGIVEETVILRHSFDTTGVLGASREDGQISPRAFPSWITVPSYQDLATGRRWHFFFAWLLVLNGLVYLAWGFASRHFGRDLLPRRVALSHIGREALEHLRLRFPRGEAAKRYNVLQQLAYLAAAGPTTRCSACASSIDDSKFWRSAAHTASPTIAAQLAAASLSWVFVSKSLASCGSRSANVPARDRSSIHY